MSRTELFREFEIELGCIQLLEAEVLSGIRCLYLVAGISMVLRTPGAGLASNIVKFIEGEAPNFLGAGKQDRDFLVLFQGYLRHRDYFRRGRP